MNPLDKATEELNKLLAEAEEVFVGLKLSVEATVPLGPTAHLGFGKCGKERAWGLYVRVTGTNQEVPIQSASRANKVLAAKQLGPLRKQLHKEHSHWLTQVRGAFDDVHSFLKEPKP